MPTLRSSRRQRIIIAITTVNSSSSSSSSSRSIIILAAAPASTTPAAAAVQRPRLLLAGQAPQHAALDTRELDTRSNFRKAHSCWLGRHRNTQHSTRASWTHAATLGKHTAAGWAGSLARSAQAQAEPMLETWGEPAQPGCGARRSATTGKHAGLPHSHGHCGHALISGWATSGEQQLQHCSGASGRHVVAEQAAGMLWRTLLQPFGQHSRRGPWPAPGTWPAARPAPQPAPGLAGSSAHVKDVCMHAFVWVCMCVCVCVRLCCGTPASAASAQPGR